METPGPTMNTTPLIDVMLVLLILFILTVPIATHTTRIDLPQARKLQPVPETIRIEVDFDGKIFWDGREASPASLDQRFRRVAQSPGTVVHVLPDRRARFQRMQSNVSSASTRS
jgi:biopolymer transport protein ExbD